jgi:Peptidase family C25
MRFLFILFLSIPFTLSGQSWYLKKTIEWKLPIVNGQNIDYKDIISFRNSYYENAFSELPKYFNLIEWDKTDLKPEVQFVSAEFQELPGEISEKQSFRELTDSIEIQSSLNYSSGKPYLQISFSPFKKNIETGKIERLTSFILELKSAKENVSTISSFIRSSKKSLQVSPLASGTWYKIRIPSTGIYKLSYQQISGMGITNPSKVRIFGYGGAELPENSLLGNQDDLLPVQIYMNKGSDGLFNAGDYILFYGIGPVNLSYDEGTQVFVHKKNYYSDFGYYFITSSDGGPDFPLSYSVPTEPANHFSSSYDALFFHELDETNLLKSKSESGWGSGREWYGELFDLTTQRNFSFQIPEFISSREVKMKINLLSRAKVAQNFIVSVNSQILDTVRIKETNLSDYTATYAYNAEKNYSFTSGSGNLNVQLKYLKTEFSSQAWLDYISINARSELNFTSNMLLFRDIGVTDAGAITEFTVKNIQSYFQIWDVSDSHNILNIPFNQNGSDAKIKVETNSLKEFVVFDSKGSFPSPQINGDDLGLIPNQNLSGGGYPDMVIVSYPDFIEYANQLADYRRTKMGLDITVTTPVQIYNEFSSGRPDVTAIRNYMQYLYRNAEGDEDLMPKYLLLFGDGSYNNKSVHPDSMSFVPTYQSENSTSPIYSYVSDDFFALLDPGEELYDGLLDIGVGRLPVSTTYQAEKMVEKIINYELPARMGDWRNTICFIGDDEDFNIHFSQANALATYVESNYPSFNINKIFLDAYQQVSTSAGQRYPAVNQAINSQVAKGALIINYTGHGGAKGLSAEQILVVDDIQLWENKTKLPLFMTATCEFSRFDEPDFVSGGEEVILNPNGGGIALFTTTRLVYSGPNHTLNEKFYEIVFQKDQNGKNYCLGEIMKYSKNQAGYGINKRNFTLLGDPSMRLSYPTFNVVTDSINKSAISDASDTLKALNKVIITGHVEDDQGPIVAFNGIIYPIVYDKLTTQYTLANDGGSKKAFTMRNNIIYKGKASVKNGYFSFSFYVPKDINYAIGTGKISYYANDSSIDASGAYLDVLIGGSSDEPVFDSEGPEVDVYINNDNFIEGGITDEDPILFVRVYDNLGINTSGNGIGHDIIAVLDNNTQNSLVLNEYYQSEMDSYQQGYVEYPLFNLSEGKHTVSVKVWDINNNSSDGFTEFIVMKTKDLLLENLLNFPNPFHDNTFFSFDHNKADQNLEIYIDIISMNGEIVKTIFVKQFSNGFRTDPIEWNGRTDNGTSNRQGTYIYRIRVKSEDGQEAVNSGKLILLR